MFCLAVIMAGSPEPTAAWRAWGTALNVIPASGEYLEPAKPQTSSGSSRAF